MELHITDIPQEFRDIATLCNATDVLIGGRMVLGIADARDLHAGLGVGRDFTNWIKGRIEKFGFREGVDFVVSRGFDSPERANQKYEVGNEIEKQSCSPILGSKIVSRNGIHHGDTQPIDFIDRQNGRTIKTMTYDGAKTASLYSLSLQMAKELAMVENNDQGRRIRRYYIWLEEALHTKATAKAKASNEPSPLDLETAREWMGLAREAGKIAGPAAARTVLERSPLLMPLPRPSTPQHETGPRPAQAEAAPKPDTRERPPRKPDAAALENRRTADDAIGRFLSIRTVRDPKSRISAAELHEAYTDWCLREGIEPETGNAFGRSCRSRLRWRKSCGRNVYLYIRLTENQPPALTGPTG